MVKELERGLYTAQQVKQFINNNSIFELKAKRGVLIGKKALAKVNLNIGVAEAKDYDCELKKIECICNLSYRPDAIMDLSVVKLKKPLWSVLAEEFDGAIGVVPHYSVFDSSKD